MPKRTVQEALATPKRAKAKGKAVQASISTFLSPSKRAKRETSVVVLSDSDDDDIVEIVETKQGLKSGQSSKPKPIEVEDEVESDEAMARRLAAEWAAEEQPTEAPDNVKVKKDVTPESKPDVKLEVKEEGEPPLKPVHPMFAKPIPVSPSKPAKAEPGISPVKKEPVAGPSRPRAGPAQPVDPVDFDMDSLLFQPSSVDTSGWPGGRLPYSILVGVYCQVAGTRSRIIIVRVLTNFLRLLLHVSPADLACSMYLLSNHLRPTYQACELGIGSSIISKVIQEVSGLQPRDLKRLYIKSGDPGDVAFEAKTNVRTLVQPAPLVAHDVYARLLKLADIKGPQSGKTKTDIIRRLLVQARGEEVRYLVRTLISNLRIGAVRLTLLTALARAAALHEAPLDMFLDVQPLPEKKKAGYVDPARDALEERCAAAAALLRRTYVRHPNYGDLVAGVQEGLEGLEGRVPLTVGIPISPMLGSITRSLDEVYARLGSLPFTAEAKLDGQRLQMHVRTDGPREEDGGGRWVEADGRRVWVRLFSRHLEDMTEKYPDICLTALELTKDLSHKRKPFPTGNGKAFSEPSAAARELLDAPKVTSLIIDAEIVAIDKVSGEKRTFQELTNRAKKGVKVEDIKVVVDICAFDLMLINDAPLLSVPLIHRRHLLRQLLLPVRSENPLLARFSHIENIDSTDLPDPVALRAFFNKVVEQKAEGLMVKLLDAGVANAVVAVDDDDDEMVEEPKSEKTEEKSRKKALPATYEPDQRSAGWLKVKKDYLEGLGDSLDLVPVGAWWGNGRKAGWWSPILLAARNPESGALEAVCKCMSGFTDAFYKSLIARFPPEGSDETSMDAPLGYVETGGLRPNIWFEPKEVWEIRGADITLSPVYPAGASYIGGERGLSLRFPRFIRIREDKGVDEATTAEELAEMYRRQMERPPPAMDLPVRPQSDEEDEEVADA